ncbi:MAG: glycosyltransferase [Deltaproteobacteria bacterium]|nr:glycosyltransferase [Deltaproteobacteria bacterium]
MEISIFGPSLSSAHESGWAAYWRGLTAALAERGHRAIYYEPFVDERHDPSDVGSAAVRVVRYSTEGEEGVWRAVEASRRSDLIVKASRVGFFDELLEYAILLGRGPSSRVAFWDLDVPVTSERLKANPAEPLAALVGRFDFVVTCGGGEQVLADYHALGARTCAAIHPAIDPRSCRPANRDPRFASDLAFHGNRRPDGEKRVDEFFFGAAGLLSRHRFLLAGAGWDKRGVPANVSMIGHLTSTERNAFNSSARAVLDVSGEAGAQAAFTPSTRLFEAAGAGACAITDGWEGVDQFFEPGREVLVAHDGREVAALVRDLDTRRAREVGAAARARVLAEHTYEHRAAELERIMSS